MDNLADVHGADDDDEDEFRPPLPMEDRLWRHPSEMGGGQARATEAPQSRPVVDLFRTPWRQGLALAALGAIGGALVVSGLFLTLGGTAPAPVVEPGAQVISTFSGPRLVPVEEQVEADRWAAEVVAHAQPGIARVVADRSTGSDVGSGVVFRSDGLLLTSHDLVKGASSVTVTLDDNTHHPAVVLGVDSISGLAVVHIDHMDLPTAPLAILKPAPQPGDYTVALGGLAPIDSLTLLRLSATTVDVPVDANRRLHGLIQLDGGAPVGSDGGGAIDDTGSVIGIVVDVDTDHATYAVPIAYARRIAEDILRYGEAKHAWLGIKGLDYADDTTLGDPDAVAAAVRVASVIDGSPAALVALRKGDLIVSIDDVEIVSMTELIMELRYHPPDDDIKIGFVRDGSTFHVTTELAVRHVDDTT